MDTPSVAVTARWPEHTYCVCLVLASLEVDPEHRAFFDAGWHPLGNLQDTPAERRKHDDWTRQTHPGVTEVMFHERAYDPKLRLLHGCVSMWAR